MFAYMNKAKFIFSFLLILVISSNNFAGGTWYNLTSATPADPEWEVVSQDNSELVLEFRLPGFFYEAIGGETYITIPSSICPIDSGIPNTPILNSEEPEIEISK